MSKSKKKKKKQTQRLLYWQEYSQSYGFFPVVRNRCENWTIKKAEHWRTDASQLCCWRRLLRVPWTARRSNQSILKEISPEYSLEGMMLKLKLQYFGHLMRRAESLEKTLMLGNTKGRRRRGATEDETVGCHHWLNDMSLSKAWETVKDRKPGVLQFMGSQKAGHDLATEQLQQHMTRCQQ